MFRASFFASSALETLLGLGLDYSNPPITSDPLCIEGSPYPQTSTQNNVSQYLHLMEKDLGL